MTSSLSTNCQRFVNELNSWADFRELGYDNPHYAEIARQKFRHMLTVLGDLMDEIDVLGDVEEHKALNNFFQTGCKTHLGSV